MEEKVVEGGGHCLSLSFSDKVWHQANHENISLVIILTFSHIRPWKLQGTQLVVGCERNIQDVLEKKEGLRGKHLHKLLVSARTLEKLPDDVVRNFYCEAVDEIFPLTKPQEEGGFGLTQAEDKQRHIRIRAEYHLTIPFQYDLYHFRNLTQRDRYQSGADVKLVVDIRCANLDAFWAREPGTVGATRIEGVKIGNV